MTLSNEERLLDVKRRLTEEFADIPRHYIGTISERDILRYAVAVGLSRYDEQASAQDCPRRISVPPGYLAAVQDWGAGLPNDDTKGDGIASEGPYERATAGMRVMGAGSRIEYFADVQEADQLWLKEGLAGVELKSGRSGSFLLVEIQIDFGVDDVLCQRVLRRAFVRLPVEE